MCGYVSVPLDYSNLGLGNTRLFVKCYTSTTSTGTLWMLQGGPGAGSTALEYMMTDMFRNLTGSYDVCTTDFRGVYRSNRLDCPATQVLFCPFSRFCFVRDMRYIVLYPWLAGRLRPGPVGAAAVPRRDAELQHQCVHVDERGQGFGVPDRQLADPQEQDGHLRNVLRHALGHPLLAALSDAQLSLRPGLRRQSARQCRRKALDHQLCSPGPLGHRFQSLTFSRSPRIPLSTARSSCTLEDARPTRRARKS